MREASARVSEESSSLTLSGQLVSAIRSCLSFLLLSRACFVLKRPFTRHISCFDGVLSFVNLAFKLEAELMLERLMLLVFEQIAGISMSGYTGIIVKILPERWTWVLSIIFVLRLFLQARENESLCLTKIKVCLSEREGNTCEIKRLLAGYCSGVDSYR